MSSGLSPDIRKRYIDILQRFEAGGGMVVSAMAQRDKNDATELKLAGCLATYYELATAYLSNGNTVTGPAWGITPKGREFLQQLREEEEGTTFIPANEEQKQDFLRSFPKAKDETARYLLILHLASSILSPSEGFIFFVDEYPPFFWTHCRELEKEGMLLGKVFGKMIQAPQNGNKAKTIEGLGYFLHGITYKGRMELARLEREEKELRDRKWRWLIPLGSFILGSLLTAIMPRVANKLLDGWLSPEVHQIEVIKFPAEGVAKPGK